MLINNNFNNQQQQAKRFNDNFQRMQEQNKRLTNTNNNKFVKDLQQHKHVNPTSRHDMHDKTLALLNDRLQKGQITMEEFNKQCTQLGKLRNMN